MNWAHLFRRPCRHNLKLAFFAVAYSVLVWKAVTNDFLILAAGVVLSFIGALIPDKIDSYREGADKEEQSKHRGLVHSWFFFWVSFLFWFSTLYILAGLVFFGLKTQEPVWLLYVINVFTAGYLIHLADDIRGYMGLPLLTGGLNDWRYKRNDEFRKKGWKKIPIWRRVFGGVLIGALLANGIAWALSRFLSVEIEAYLIGFLFLFVLFPVAFVGLSFYPIKN